MQVDRDTEILSHQKNLILLMLILRKIQKSM